MMSANRMTKILPFQSLRYSEELRYTLLFFFFLIYMNKPTKDRIFYWIYFRPSFRKLKRSLRVLAFLLSIYEYPRIRLCENWYQFIHSKQQKFLSRDWLPTLIFFEFRNLGAKVVYLPFKWYIRPSTLFQETLITLTKIMCS